MHIARVISVYTEDNDYKIIFLCGINDDASLVNGEWFGSVDNSGEIYPFVLERGQRLFYGGEENSSERTNFGERPIQQGSYFTVFGDEGESVYQITTVHLY